MKHLPNPNFYCITNDGRTTEVSVKTYEAAQLRKIKGSKSRTESGRLQIWNFKILKQETSARLLDRPPLSFRSTPTFSSRGLSSSIDKRLSAVTSTMPASFMTSALDTLTIHTSTVDAEGNLGHMLEMPEAPYLVFFQRDQTDGLEDSTPGAYLAVRCK